MTDLASGESITLCNDCAEHATSSALELYAAFGVQSVTIAGIAAELSAMSAMLGLPDLLISSDIGRCGNHTSGGDGDDAA